VKQRILSEISSKLSVLGIQVQNGNGADITINTEFLDAGWSTGSKKISYEASVFANEQENVIYMYEKTTEVGHGLSFGGGSGSSFQSGITLFRKVKSVQYGLDGKAYEYTLDLGAIPKAVKETAKQYGWKFKIVLNKNKAMYPAGYVPSFVPPAKQAQPVEQASQTNVGFCSNCGMQLMESAKFCDKCGKPVGAVTRQTAAAPHVPPVQPQPTAAPVQPQYGDPRGVFYAAAPKKSGGKGGTFGLIGFILLGILLIVMLLAAEGTPVGWVVSLVLFAVAFFIQRKLKKKGCLLHLILWIITGFLLLVVLTMFTTGEFSFTTAGLKNAHMTTAMDANGKPVDRVRSYSPNALELVAVAELRNAPTHTKVKFTWSYVTNDMPIGEYVMDSGDNDANVYVFSNLTNDKPWPEGKYRVEMYVADNQEPDATVEFTVVSDTTNTTANPQNTQTTTKVDGSGNPVPVAVNSGPAIKPNVDEINITDYFQKILDQVKKEWKSDAQIISIRMDKSFEKNFNSLRDLKVDSNWRVIFYSLSTMNEAVVDLDNSKKNSQGVPVIKYQTEQEGALTMEEIKNKGLKIYEYNRPETAKIHQQVPENCLTGSNIKMSEILEVLNERFKNERYAEKGYYLTMNGIKGPKLDIYWEKGSTKNRFVIELDTKKSYDQQ